MPALVDRLRALPASSRAAILATLSEEEQAALLWEWERFFARPDERSTIDPREGRGQLPPAGRWRWWALMGGRGAGKTEGASRYVNKLALLGHGVIVHLLGQTIEDAMATMVGVERGEAGGRARDRKAVEVPNMHSGLLATAPPWNRPRVVDTEAGVLLLWPSGAKGRVFGAERARKGRGPQCNVMWIDDPAAFGEHGRAVAEQLELGFRLPLPDGGPARGVISSTWADSAIMDWLREKEHVVYSRSETDDNRANLDEGLFADTLKHLAGSDLEAVERRGEDPKASGATKVFRGIDFTRPPIRRERAPEKLRRVVVWVDPSVSSATRACEVGIVAVGETEEGLALVLEDASGHYGARDTADGSMRGWPNEAIDCLERWEDRAAVVGFGVESNRMEAQAEALLSTAIDLRRQKAIAEGRRPRLLVQIVTVHTHKTKAERAALLVSHYLAGNISHLPGLALFETQLSQVRDAPRQQVGRTPRAGLDRADAGVYGLLDIFRMLDRVRPGAVGRAAAPVSAGAFGASSSGALIEPPRPERGRFTMSAPAGPGAFGRSGF